MVKLATVSPLCISYCSVSYMWETGSYQKICQSKKTLRGGGTSNARNSRQSHAQTIETSNPRLVRAVQNETTVRPEEYSLHNVNSPAPTKPIMLEVVIKNQSVSMKLDTGSAVTLVSEHTFKSKWPDIPLQVSNVKLRTYSNESLQVLGQIEAKIQYNEQKVWFPLIVVKGNGPTLFGTDWLAHIQLDWKKIHSIQKCGVAEVFPCVQRNLRYILCRAMKHICMWIHRPNQGIVRPDQYLTTLLYVNNSGKGIRSFGE